MVTHIKTIIDRVTFWADLTTKTSKTNGFDTIEIDLVSLFTTIFSVQYILIDHVIFVCFMLSFYVRMILMITNMCR